MRKSKHVGLQRGFVKLVSHKPHWHSFFEKEKKAILSLLGELAIAIEHVGSTSVKGMLAKPIIDISIRVKSLKDAKKCARKLNALGYEHRKKGDKPGLIFFVRGKKPDIRFVHLSLIYADRAWCERVFFRNYLRKYKSIALKYVKLKKKLAKKFPDNRKAYTAGKDKFIRKILKQAGKRD